MYVVLLLAAIAIIGGVVVVAMGRGGELVIFRRDLPLSATLLRTPADVARVQLPFAPFGYQVQATSDALVAAARMLAVRDAEIAALRMELGGGPPELPADEAVAADLDPQQGP